MVNINPNQGRSLLFPYVRVTVGNKDIFTTSDGYLQSATFTLNEMEAGSSCSFTIYDPGSKLTDKYFQIIKDVGGLTPVEAKEESKRNEPLVPYNDNDSGASLGSANMKAMLDTIGWAEGAKYNVQFTGSTFSSYKDHPRQIKCSGSLCSDAAGRYQFLSTTWDAAKSALNLPDFTPKSQDKAAIYLINKVRNAGAEVEAGDISGALEKLSYEWASLPPYRYSGQGSKTKEEVLAYFKQMRAKYGPGVQEAKTAVNSSLIAANIPKVNIEPTPAYIGSQITVEMGFNGLLLAASSFIHQSCNHPHFNYPALTFEGQSAAWVLTQRKKNTAYKDITLKQIASKITAAYGLKLNMKVDGPKYLYFPQRGQTDYEALLIECKRIGYKIYCKGNTLFIYPGLRENREAFVLRYGDNAGFTFNVSHKAQTEGDDKKYASGQRKTIVDPKTGVQKIINLENPIGTGIGAEKFTTGDSKPEPKPKTDGTTDVEDDARREGQTILAQIDADFSCPTTPELLTLDPNSAFVTQGFSDFLDRYWIIKSITHTYDVNSGFTTSGTLYSPIKRGTKAAKSTIATSSPTLNPNGWIKPVSGGYGDRLGAGRNHGGVDILGVDGEPVLASKDGIVTDVENSCVIGDINCGGRFGNLVYLDHGGGFISIYAHLQTSSVKVAVGDKVSQGQPLGKQGNTGHSFGSHLHFEIHKNGVKQEPTDYIK